jgi:ABC-type transport system involved in cytochrome bd biosynthesis fused ATPase/permease subunit
MISSMEEMDGFICCYCISLLWWCLNSARISITGMKAGIHRLVHPAQFQPFYLEASGLHQMILRFPKGYDTPMGEAGSLLSGGQRQRIGLARALYGEPPLVVLDEPNANLDDEGEAALVRAVQAMKAKGKTVVLISHRPGIVSVADRLLILHQGTVQASGPRDGVLAALQKQREAAAQAAQANQITQSLTDVDKPIDGTPSTLS